MRRFVVLIALASMMVPGSSRAEEPTGCEVIASGIGRGNCRYTANGPGTYEVATLSGFRITAWHADGTAETLASATGTTDRPHTAVAVRGGDLATRAGDLVDVAIGVARSNGMTYMNGYAKAGPAGG